MVEALGAFVLERTAESVVLAARRTLVGRLLRLRLTDWERLPPGDLMSRVTSDTTLLRAVSTQAVVSAATGAVAFVAAIVLLAVLDVVSVGRDTRRRRADRRGRRSGDAENRTSHRTAQEAVGEISIALERVFGGGPMRNWWPRTSCTRSWQPLSSWPPQDDPAPHMKQRASART